MESAEQMITDKACLACKWSIQGTQCWICVNRAVAKYMHKKNRKNGTKERTMYGTYIYGYQTCLTGHNFSFSKGYKDNNAKAKILKLHYCDKGKSYKIKGWKPNKLY